MTPLEHLLDDRRETGPGWRAALAGCLGGSSRLAKRLIWPRRLKHMRYLPPGITLRAEAKHCWTISKIGSPLVTSRQLLEVLPASEKPVSIVATGPSARDYPWDSVCNGERMLIGVNGAPTMLKELGIRPDLLVVTDREFALTGIHHFEAAPDVPLVIEFLAAAALAANAPHVLTERPVVILERANLWHGLPALDHRALSRLNAESDSPFVLPETPDPKCRVGWSHRPELGIFSGRTVVFGALQVVIGSGAKDVEIIGMDLGGSGRSYAEGTDQRPTQLQVHYEQFILPSFRVMRHALEGSEVSVRNLSPVCPLPAELFAADPGVSQT